MKIGIVSGFFSPLHGGHCDYLNAAKQDGDFLVVIVNNDKQVELKSGSVIMDEQHRLKIIQNLKATDIGVMSIDEDLTVYKTLQLIRSLFPQVCFKLTFYNSGDRDTTNTNEAENVICQKLNIDTKFLPLPKIYSSRNLREKIQ